MIEQNKKHIEKMKLSDKFQQPFETSSVREAVSIFNGRRQKKTSKRKKK